MRGHFGLNCIKGIHYFFIFTFSTQYMELIIAGSRDIKSREVVQTAIEESEYRVSDIDTLLCGMADGVDSISKELIKDSPHQITIEEYPVKEYLDDAPNPSVAPLLRNSAMATNATALLAVWDGKSTGTQDMIQKAKQENLSIEIHRTDTNTLADF